MDRRSARCGVVWACVLAWGCVPADPVSEAPDGRAERIADAAHGGETGFWFLPPMVANPQVDGVFDGSRSTEVFIGSFDASGGTPTELVRFGPGAINVSSSSYSVDWDTDAFDLDPDRTYRIVVVADGVALGAADVEVARKGSELRNLDTGAWIGLVDGRTLPIRYRIEEGAGSSLEGGLCVADSDCGSLVCDRFVCQPATCDDAVANQGESDVDCGGACEPCADGAACGGDADCLSDECDEDGLCVTPTCDDGVANQGEEGVDCGGPCGPCLVQTEILSGAFLPGHEDVLRTAEGLTLDARTGLVAAWDGTSTTGLGYFSWTGAQWGLSDRGGDHGWAYDLVYSGSCSHTLFTDTIGSLTGTSAVEVEWSFYHSHSSDSTSEMGLTDDSTSGCWPETDLGLRLADLNWAGWTLVDQATIRTQHVNQCQQNNFPIVNGWNTVRIVAPGRDAQPEVYVNGALACTSSLAGGSLWGQRFFVTEHKGSALYVDDVKITSLRDTTDASGTITTGNVLAGLTGAVPARLAWDATVPAGTSAFVRFGSDGVTWTDASGGSGWTALTDGTGTIDLGALSFGGAFRAQIRLESYDSAAAAPVVHSLVLGRL